MRLVDDWKWIAIHAHSMWANYLGILCLLAPEVIYWIWGVDTNPRIWWIAGLILIVYGLLGRLKAQRDKIKGILLAGLLGVTPQADASTHSYEDVLSIAVPLIARWEGLETTAYQDIVGVWTVCYGETRGVKPGDTYTADECKEMLAWRVVGYHMGWLVYLNDETRKTRLHAAREAAFTSLAYNVGIAGAGKSTATRRLNAGNVAGACQAIGWWNRAGGRVVRGLVNRRTEEVVLCMRGLS